MTAEQMVWPRWSLFAYRLSVFLWVSKYEVQRMRRLTCKVRRQAVLCCGATQDISPLSCLSLSASSHTGCRCTAPDGSTSSAPCCHWLASVNFRLHHRLRHSIRALWSSNLPSFCLPSFCATPTPFRSIVSTNHTAISDIIKDAY
jgi:hypothetical protein